jgi:hypothetical protein
MLGGYSYGNGGHRCWLFVGWLCEWRASSDGRDGQASLGFPREPYLAEICLTRLALDDAQTQRPGHSCILPFGTRLSHAAVCSNGRHRRPLRRCAQHLQRATPPGSHRDEGRQLVRRWGQQGPRDAPRRLPAQPDPWPSSNTLPLLSRRLPGSDTPAYLASLPASYGFDPLGLGQWQPQRATFR